MADNRFDNNQEEFEDIYSSSGEGNEPEEVCSSSDKMDIFDEISARLEETEDNDSIDPLNDTFAVRYNATVQNRRRQEIEYEDIAMVYGDLSSDESQKEKKKTKKQHRALKGVAIALSVIIVIVSCLGIFAYTKLDKLLSKFDTTDQLGENIYINAADLTQYPDQINVLLVGVDSREGETQSRSDTMMLLTLDNKHKQIKLTSFLRDSYVEIAGKNFSSKLNSSYFYGGIQMLSDTLELNFKIDIQYYALVDFEIFTTIVDQLGGINVDVTEKESYYTYHSGKVQVPVRIEAGKDVLLNGEQALWYSRIRYLDSDFKRTERQRKVITAIVEKASTKSVNELYTLAENIIPLVKTNMSSDQIMSLGLAAVKNQVYNYPIVQHQIPADGTWNNQNISGVGDSLVMNMNENVTLLHNFLGKKQEVPAK